ncbi:MAG: cytidylate kinase-like family protein [Eubacteriales bacterium]|nr:cytidylate kinase-like family protein [Eubacteriales bacterium]
MGNLIITISREYGSGGREVGKKLAERLGIDFYDKEIITMMAKESGLSEETIRNWAEKEVSGFFYGINAARGIIPIPDRIFSARRTVLREIAEKGSCVIVGSCGDYILKDCDNIHKFFIYAPKELREQRVKEVYGEDTANHPNLIRRKDEERRDYYNHFTNYKFGDYKNYDACFNSAIGIDKVVDIIEQIVK